MFSALGSIFSITPRQAEQTDARQDIQRHDPEYERRRKDKKPLKEDDSTQDNATISVDALRTFLENFVKNGAKEGNNKSAPSKDATPNEQSSPLDFKIQTEMTLGGETETNKQSGAAAYAASSYQSAASANEKSSVLLETTDAAIGPSLDLSAADIRTVYTLIEDLKTLETANIEYLHIQRADSFLESLINAVNKIKTTL